MTFSATPITGNAPPAVTSGRRQPPLQPHASSKTPTVTSWLKGDTVALIKDLKLGSGSQVLKAGTKAKNIRLQDGDHEIACKIDGSSMALKACFVKKA